MTFKNVRRLALWPCLGLAAMHGAHASLTASDITLSAPGGIFDVSTQAIDAVNSPIAGGDGVKATSGDGTAIGGYMLSGGGTSPAESISFVGNDIDVTIDAGAQTDSNAVITGYLGAGGQSAQYIFDNLAVNGLGLGGAVVTQTGGGLVSPAAVAALVSIAGLHTLTVNLDSEVFADLGNGSSNDYVSLQIALTPAAAVPEPEGVLLALAGAACLMARGVARRRSIG